MKPHEQIAQLEKEKAALEEQVAGLKKRVTELEAAQAEVKEQGAGRKRPGDVEEGARRDCSVRDAERQISR